MSLRSSVAAAVLAVAGSCLVVADAAEITVGAHTFTVPDGFTVELAAGPPLVERPITMAFDEKGRLYVTDSSGDSSRGPEQLKRKSHRIRRLEDTDGDGVFDKSTLFADGMMFPEGSMWLDGSLYVAAPPSIWKLTDTDDDGVSDHREEWFQGKTLTGCANDLHGPYLGVDGWIYWCKGAFAEQTYVRPGKKPFVTRAAHIFRRHPDGDLVEPVMTGGMDNPVDVTFLPNGERFFTTTFLQHPLAGKRDGIIHAIYGGVYGKEHGVLDGHPRTGGLLSPMTHLGAAAPCGLTTYRSLVFGDEFENNLFATLFNMRKVTRHVLTPESATYKSTDSDFLVSSNLDFHPTDVIDDADGSLLVIDTGGWYRICCPTSQLQKSDVLGGIYRVRRVGATVPTDPRGHAIDWQGAKPTQLAELLGDGRPDVRGRAVEELGMRGVNSIPALGVTLGESTSSTARTSAVWALTRIDHDDARAQVRRALDDSDPTVRHAALHSVAVRRDRAAVPRVTEILRTGKPPLRRAAAEVLGRTGSASAVPVLLELVVDDDTGNIVDHSLMFAVIEIGEAKPVREALASKNRSVCAAALTCLDQIDGVNLRPAEVVPFLIGRSFGARAARSVVARHPDWASKIVAALSDEFDKGPVLGKRRLLFHALESLGPSDSVQRMLARLIRSPSTRAGLTGRDLAGIRHSALETLHKLRPKKLHPEVPPALEGALKIKFFGVEHLVVQIAYESELPVEESLGLRRALLAWSKSDRTAGIDLFAVAAAAGRGVRLDDDTFRDVLSCLVFHDDAFTESDVLQGRDAAVRVLERCGLERTRRGAIIDRLDRIGPLELPRVFARLTKGADESSALRLAEALPKSPGFPALRIDEIEKWMKDAPDSVKAKGPALIAALRPDREKQRAVLVELLKALPEGNLRRGQIVFNGEKAACSRCHPFGYLGGRVGPDLTRIGGIRSRADLLEALVFPSASLVRGFESTTVITKKGDTHHGIVVDKRGSYVNIVTDADRHVELLYSDIAEKKTSLTSVMPTGLAELLSRQQLADLLAFLQASR